MANEKVLELLKDENFIKELGTAVTPEDAQKLFEAKGAEITIEELKAIRAMARQQSGEKLEADELDLVAGGADVFRFVGDKLEDAIIAIADSVRLLSW